MNEIKKSRKKIKKKTDFNKEIDLIAKRIKDGYKNFLENLSKYICAQG